VAITFVDWPDRTRWKVINNILGLPFEEPEETYSTSAHLYHDQGIEPGTKGRLNEAPAAPAPVRSREPRPDRSRPDRPASQGKPRTQRTRRRLKNGVAVAEDGTPAPDHAEQTPVAEQTNGRGSHDRRAADNTHGGAAERSTASADGQASGVSDETRPKRRRRRRSSGGSASAAAAPDSVPATGH
jgi:hypothetical protein